MGLVWKALGAACAMSLVGAAPPRAAQWTPAWTASMWRAAEGKQDVAVDNATISFSIRLGIGGDRIRLRLSNEYGAPLRIGAATVRVAGGSSVAVTFGKQASVNLPAGGQTVTDAARLRVKPFEVVQVSLYLPDAVRLNTVHGAAGAKVLVSAAGDHSAAAFEAARRVDSRPLLAGVEVLADKPRPVVVAFGDSITDNVGCAIDAVPLCRWGDVLGRRLAQAGKACRGNPGDRRQSRDHHARGAKRG